MYIAALQFGVPLKKGEDIQKDADLSSDFALAPETVTAFNSWLGKVDRSVDRVEDAMKFGMGQLLSWRTLRATPGGGYVTGQAFFKAAQEDAVTPHQVAQAVDEAQKTDPQLQDMNGQLAQAEQKRTLATKNTQYPANMAEISACNNQIAAVTETIDRRNEALYGEVAQKTAPARPGEDAYSVSTNDRTDLLQGAEEMRLLLGHLYPAEAQDKWQLQLTQPVVSHSNRVYPPEPPAPPQLAVTHVSPSGPMKPNEPLWIRPQMRLVDGGIAFHTMRTLKFFNPNDDVMSAPHDKVVPFLLQHTSPEAVKQLPAEAITLFDDYVHDSRCWFRVPYFHEYAPGGYGWPRIVFIGGNERSPWFGFDPLHVPLDTAGSDRTVPA